MKNQSFSWRILRGGCLDGSVTRCLNWSFVLVPTRALVRPVSFKVILHFTNKTRQLSMKPLGWTFFLNENSEK